MIDSDERKEIFILKDYSGFNSILFSGSING